MPTVTIATNSARLPSKALRRFSWGVFIYFIAVILWGALVRATGSGAGCGEHWPLCNGVVIQHSPRLDTIIELTHRITSGLSFFSALILLAWTFAGTARGHLARITAAAIVVFTLLEAVLGALLVKLGLTAQSQSPLRAPYLALHLTNTLLLLAALVLTAHLLHRNTAYLRNTTRLQSLLIVVIGLCSVMIVGVTGSLAALGDTLFPASSVASAFAQDFSHNSNWLVRWRWSHPATAVLACIFILWMLRHAVQCNQRKSAVLIPLLLIMQIVLGVFDVILLAPIWLQITHLLVADILWAALVVLGAKLSIVDRHS